MESSLWAVVYTKPGREVDVMRGLLEQDYLAWMPRCMVRLKINRAWRFEPRPLFPRYLFAVVSHDQPRTPIANTRGVSHLLTKPDGSLAYVPGRVIERLQERTRQDGGVIKLDGPAPTRARFIPGESVTIADGGPFHGLAGLVQQDKGERVTILLQLLGGERKLSVAAGILRTAEAA